MPLKDKHKMKMHFKGSLAFQKTFYYFVAYYDPLIVQMYSYPSFNSSTY